MNIPKKQMKVPTWMPTAVAVLAIVAIIMLIYIVVTSISGPQTEDPTPSPAPSLSSTPAPSPDVTPAPTITPADSQSSLYKQVSAYLTSDQAINFTAGSLEVYSLETPYSDTSLVYAKYMIDGYYHISEYKATDSISSIDTDDTELFAYAKEVRADNSVASLYIQALVSNFYLSRTRLDKVVLASTLSTQSEADAEIILKSMEYVDSISVSSLSVNPISSGVVNYVVFATDSTRLVGISTAAPGLSEFLISLDPEHMPFVFIGSTDDAADSARAALKSSQSYKDLLDTVNADLTQALDSDAALKAAYEHMFQ